MAYQPLNKVRIVTAASLFDGHDAAINIMRRILQSKGAEIIHLGHNRSVKEIVEAAIEEDVQCRPWPRESRKRKADIAAVNGVRTHVHGELPGLGLAHQQTHRHRTH